MSDYCPITGHLISCKFIPRPNRGHGLRPMCSAHLQSGENCQSLIGLQSCWLKTCASWSNHWGRYCNKHKPRWDKHLSACANNKADELGLTYEERLLINQTNIKQILGLPSHKTYQHISNARRKEVDESIELSEESVDESDSEDDDYKPDEEEKRTEKRLRDSDVSERPKKRRRTEASSDSDSDMSEDKNFIDDGPIEYDSSSESEPEAKDSEEEKDSEKVKEFCGNCGKNKIDNDKFCRNCGTQFFIIID